MRPSPERTVGHGEPQGFSPDARGPLTDPHRVESPAHCSQGGCPCRGAKSTIRLVPKAGTALAGLAALLALLFPLTLATPQAAGAATAAVSVTSTRAATLTGPITVGHVVEPLSAHPLDLAASGYVEQEYFASGTATAFKADSMPSDGKWTVTPTTTARYKTRILVRRPADPAHFNGTVIVEWMNVSAGESAPDWDFLNPMLMREGYAYVGVSAQALGVDGGKALLGSPDRRARAAGLVGGEPARYGTLHHPGDQYALDMYAQIGQALRRPAPTALGRPEATHVLAIGESQSAFYLTTFADALQPLTNVYDGIFIHSRGGSGASLGRNIHHDEQRARQSAHPHRPEGPRLHVRDPDRPDPARLRPRAAAQHRQDPHVGDRRHRPRRRLHRRRRREPPRLHDAGEQRPPAQRGPGRVHRVRQVGRQRHATPEPAALQVVEHPSGGVGARCARQRDRRRPHTGGRRPGVHPERRAGRAGANAICSPLRIHRRRSPRPSSPASTAPRAITSPQYTKSLDKAIASGYILSADKASLLAQAEQVQFPASVAPALRGRCRRQGPTRPVRRGLAPKMGLPGLIEPEDRQSVSSPSSPASHPHEHSPMTPTRPTKLVTWDTTCTNWCSSDICRLAGVVPPLARGHVWDLRVQRRVPTAGPRLG